MIIIPVFKNYFLLIIIFIFFIIIGLLVFVKRHKLIIFINHLEIKFGIFKGYKLNKLLQDNKHKSIGLSLINEDSFNIYELEDSIIIQVGKQLLLDDLIKCANYNNKPIDSIIINNIYKDLNEILKYLSFSSILPKIIIQISLDDNNLSPILIDLSHWDEKDIFTIINQNLYNSNYNNFAKNINNHGQIITIINDFYNLSVWNDYSRPKIWGIYIHNNNILYNKELNDFLYKYHNYSHLVSYDNKYNKFLIKRKKIILSILGLILLISIINRYVIYIKLQKIITKGQKIIEDMNLNNNHQITENKGQDFLKSLTNIKISRLQTIFNKKKINDIHNFFLKVYIKSVLNNYDEDIKNLSKEIELPINEIELNDLCINDKHLSLTNTIIFNEWNIYINKIKKLQEMLKKYNNILIDQNDKNSPYLGKIIINKYFNNKNNKYGLFVPNIRNLKEKIYKNLLILHNKLLNTLGLNILCAKNELDDLLSNWHKNNKHLKYSLHILKSLNNFLDIINDKSNDFLDHNIFISLYKTINFLEDMKILSKEQKINLINRGDMHLYKIKKEIFSFNNKIISSIELGLRKDMINQGSISLIVLKNLLNTFCQESIVQVLMNQDNIKESLILKDIPYWSNDKLKLIDKFVGKYNNFINNRLDEYGVLFKGLVELSLENHGNIMVHNLLCSAIILKNKNQIQVKDILDNFLINFKILSGIYNTFSNVLDENKIKIFILQIDYIVQYVCNVINNMWFSKLNCDNWDGNSNLLEHLTLLSNKDDVYNMFNSSFKNLKNILFTYIVPLMNVLTQQNIILENQLPWDLMNIMEILTIIMTYDKKEKNNLKQLEEQILNFNNLDDIKDFRWSSRDFFNEIHHKLYCTVVNKREVFKLNKALFIYKKIQNYYNKYCAFKIPFSYISENITPLKNIQELNDLFQGNKNDLQPLFLYTKYKKEQFFLNFLEQFFKLINVNEDGVSMTNSLDFLPYYGGSANNNLILRFSGIIGDNEQHNFTKLSDVVFLSNSFLEISMDVAKQNDSYIPTHGYVVETQNGCNIISEKKWGLWLLISRFIYSNDKNELILKISAPLIISSINRGDKPKQEWIVCFFSLKGMIFWNDNAP